MLSSMTMMRSSKTVVAAAAVNGCNSAAAVPLMQSQTRKTQQLQQVRGMAVNPNEIKKKIVSTKSIMKITKSMKMVSAAKMKQDEKRLKDGKEFGKTFDIVFGGNKASLEDITAGTAKLALDKPTLLAVMTSDRGLCGGINSYASKAARLRMDKLTSQGTQNSLFVLGLKGEGALRRTHGKKLVLSIDEATKTPMNFAKASVIATKVLEAAGDSKQIDIVYNSFKSVIAYITTVKSIPNFPAILKANGDDAALPAPLDQYELEPEVASEAVQNLMEFGLATSIYGSIIDSATSEQSARMQAMENASSNAGDMIGKLTVQFNRARQAKITTELIEIISGAESLKSSQ